MNAVIDIAFPVFGLALIGYIATWKGWFPDSGIAGLSRYVFDWAVPVLLIRTLSRTEIPDNFPWDLILAFYIPACITYSLSAIFSVIAFKREFTGAVIFGFGSSYGNSIMVGIPLILLGFGEEGAVPFFILLSFHGLSYFMVTTVLLTYGQSKGTNELSFLKLVKGLVNNPIIVALVVGISMNVMGIRLGGPVDRIAEYLQLSVVPCALFALGAGITRYQIRGQLAQSTMVVVFKNLLFPILVWIMGEHVFELPSVWTAVAVVLAATPTGVNVFLFAERFGVATSLASTSVMISTIVSIATLSFVLYALV